MEEPENVLYLQRCKVCGETFLGAGKCCSRTCRMIWVADTDFSMLSLILANARWAGGYSQEEILAACLHLRLLDAVRRLPQSADPLAELLIEIAQEIETSVGACLRRVH
jgi:hypothetical protein